MATESLSASTRNVRLKRLGVDSPVRLSAGGGASVGASPMQAAEKGFSGAGSQVPYRKEMESSFGGVDFSDVRSYSGSAAKAANQSLGANAYAAGNQVAFKSDNPSRSLVAHELTHVLQQSGGVKRSVQGEGMGIDTGGEAEANAVESAVASGRSASSALTGAAKIGGVARKVALNNSGVGGSGGGGAPAGAGGGTGGGGGGAGTRAGPAGSRVSSAPAGGGFGFGISGDAFQAAGTYEIWTRSYSWPIPALPGMNVMINPNVTAQVQGSLAASGDHQVQAGIQGAVGIGASLGIANGVEGYLTVGPSLNLRATLLREGGVTSFRVGGEIGVSGRIGVKIGGTFDLGIDIFNVGLLRLDATWTRGAAGWAWDSSRSGFGPGASMVGIWNTVATMWRGIRAAYDAGARVVHAGTRTAGDAARAVGRAGGRAYDWVMSW